MRARSDILKLAEHLLQRRFAYLVWCCGFKDVFGFVHPGASRLAKERPEKGDLC